MHIFSGEISPLCFNSILVYQLYMFTFMKIILKMALV